jgi:hypothetical protein
MKNNKKNIPHGIKLKTEEFEDTKGVIRICTMVKWTPQKTGLNSVAAPLVAPVVFL